MNDLFRAPFLAFAFLAAGLALSFFLHRRVGRGLFGILNPLACFFIFYWPQEGLYPFFFITYFLIALMTYALLWLPGRLPFWGVTSFLIGLLILTRLLPNWWTFADYAVVLGDWAPYWIGHSGFLRAGSLVGFSYFCFRLILLTIELRQPAVPRPDLATFLGFAFFLPHFVCGPITPFAHFRTAFATRRRRDSASLFRCAVRFVLGIAKFFFLSGLFYQLTLSRLWSPSFSISWGQLLISMTAYTFFMYLNFSGFIDVMVAASYLCGIESKENFDAPLLATSLRDFWKRWHISLTDFLQIVIFNPLMRVFNGWNLPFNLALSLATLAVFTVMGLWHGFQWNYAAFSLLHALGLIATLFWPKHWRIPNWLSGPLTFSYVTLCFFFFENEPARIAQIWSQLFHNF